jgi:hypothetical protein
VISLRTALGFLTEPAAYAVDLPDGYGTAPSAMTSVIGFAGRYRTVAYETIPPPEPLEGEEPQQVAATSHSGLDLTIAQQIGKPAYYLLTWRLPGGRLDTFLDPELGDGGVALFLQSLTVRQGPGGPRLLLHQPLLRGHPREHEDVTVFRPVPGEERLPEIVLAHAFRYQRRRHRLAALVTGDRTPVARAAGVRVHCADPSLPEGGFEALAREIAASVQDQPSK